MAGFWCIRRVHLGTRKAGPASGADDARSFLRPPLPEALDAGPGNRLLARQQTGVWIELAEVEALPLADGKTTVVSCLVGLFGPEAGFHEARLASRQGRLQLLLAQP